MMQRKMPGKTRPIITRLPPAGHRCAFTLLELLIVSGLLASVAAFSWPSVRRSLARAEHRRAVDDVCSLLAEARSRAVTRGRPHLVRIDAQHAEMKLFEVRFDEAGADKFESDPSGLQARRPHRSARAQSMAPATGIRPQRTAAPRVGALSPHEHSGVAADSCDLSVAELKLVVSRELPTNFRCRRARGDASPSPGGESFPGQNALAGPRPKTKRAPVLEASVLDGSVLDASALNASVADGADAHFVRLVFDVEGRTRDARLEICGPDGLCTPLSLVGALGNVMMGTPLRHVTTNPAVSVPEAVE